MGAGHVHVSEGMLSGCLENGIGAEVMHEVIQSGFALEQFRSAQQPAEWKALLDVAEGASKPVVILMMAALEPRKRHHQLLDLLPPIIAEYPQTRIVFAGEGPLHQDIRAKADALGIGHSVKLVGYRQDPERLIALSDISILSSGQEGLPRCILQSIVGGRPTVAFDLPGLDAVVKTGKNGFVVPMDDWVAFGQALEKLVADAKLRGSMAAAAAMTDLSHWDWRHMGSRTNAFYERLLDAKGGRSRALA
jgi:glycosyltransferase involved in cell wall biosynthesis